MRNSDSTEIFKLYVNSVFPAKIVVLIQKKNGFNGFSVFKLYGKEGSCVLVNWFKGYETSKDHIWFQNGGQKPRWDIRSLLIFVNVN